MRTISNGQHPRLRSVQRYATYRSGEGQSESVDPTFNLQLNIRGGNTMSHIYNFLDNHMEVSGAVVFGILALGACVALAAAINGVL